MQRYRYQHVKIAEPVGPGGQHQVGQRRGQRKHALVFQPVNDPFQRIVVGQRGLHLAQGRRTAQAGVAGLLREGGLVATGRAARPTQPGHLR
ncbi:hypothetical protein RZS08_17165, partial [Arthrospira platensis SPKY1]|nr:hypothetical protein [Arthrospira platensis SPKY1]